MGLRCLKASSVLKLSIPAKTYTPMLRCIYCGTRTGPFGDEHIIPYSIWGKLVLPRSSCKECEKITCRFEQVVAKQILGPFRAALEAPSRRKPSPTLRFRSRGRTVEIDRDKAPAVVSLPVLSLSKAARLSPSHVNATRMWQIFLDQDREKEVIDPYEVIPDFDASSFFRMLAKAAHSYLLGEMQHRLLPEWENKRIEYLLPPFILGEATDFESVIGGYREILDATDDFHIVKVGTQVVTNTSTYPAVTRYTHIIVHIRLFAWLRSPEYHITAAKLIDSS